MKYVLLFLIISKSFSQNEKPIDTLSGSIFGKIFTLEEVIIAKHSEINALKLGILSNPVKKYTIQERRYFTAISGPISLLINSLNGNIMTLKKNIEVEKKIKLLEDLSNLINNSFYIDVLKISKEDILKFKYFIIEDAGFRQEFNLKSINLIQFKMIELSIKFKQIQ